VGAEPAGRGGSSITVKVRTIGPLKALFGTGDLEVDLPAGARVEELLGRLTQSFGEGSLGFFAPNDAGALPHLRIMVNGRDIGVLGGRQALLTDADEILLLTPVAGG
jgi:molybdopterin converting factor small subunit